jgi:hypothetical protein
MPQFTIQVVFLYGNRCTLSGPSFFQTLVPIFMEDKFVLPL